MLKITKFNNNSLEQNTFIFHLDGKQIIIDPGLNFKEVESKVDFTKETIILLTHYHFDHSYSTDYFGEKYGIKSHLHENDKYWFLHDDGFREVVYPYLEKPVVTEDTHIHQNFGLKTHYFKDKIEELPSLEIIHVPGHTDGSVMYKIGSEVFSGDALFFNSIGRYDIAGSSIPKTRNSIELFKNLDDNLMIYPAHGRSSKMDELRKENRFLWSGNE